MSMKSLDLDEFAATRYEEKNGTQIVSVTGEVDLSSAPRLAEVIGRAKEQAGGDPSHVVVDLSEVEFMDTAGLEVLSAARREDVPRGTRGTTHAVA